MDLDLKSAAFEKALREAGLPPNVRPDSKPFAFWCAHESHRHLLRGNIQKISPCDSGEMRLEVSNEIVCGRKIRAIVRVEDEWAVFLDSEPLTEREMDEMTGDEFERRRDQRYLFGTLKIFP